MFIGKTIRSRLLIVNIFIAFFLVVVITGIFYTTSRTRMSEQVTNTVVLEVEHSIAYIELEFAKIYETTETLYFFTNNLIVRNETDGGRDELLHYAETIIEENQNIIGVNFVFEPNVIEDDIDFVGQEGYQFDGAFITYISKQHDVLDITYIDQYDNFEFYTRAVSHKHVFFTEPYDFEVQGELLTISTVVFPIVINGEFLGLVGIDFTAEYILGTMNNQESTYPRRDIILSQDGIILTNSNNPDDFGKHISTIHPNYFIGMSNVDAQGLVVSQMGTENRTEILASIELGDSGDHWYIFSDISNHILVQDINNASYIVIVVGVVLFALYILISSFVNTSITKPIDQFSQHIATFDIETSSIEDLVIDTKNLDDLALLIHRYVESVTVARNNLELIKQQSIHQEDIIQLQSILNETTNMEELTKAITKHAVDYTASLLGGLYLFQNNAFHLMSTVGGSFTTTRKYSLGEGFVGQVAESKTPLILSDKALSPIIDTGITDVSPPHLLVYPIIEGNQTIAVLELVSLQPFADQVEQMLARLQPIYANTLERELGVLRTEILYQKAKDLSVELEEQQEELRVKNEELESQQEELRVSNEELENQQEELRVTNKELEFNLGQIELINKELEQTKNELLTRTQEAERSNQYKSDFLANMSHELRTPLNSILILSNLISEQESVSPKLQEYASTIHSAGSDLLELINGILDLSKIESGQVELNIETCDCHDMIQELEKQFQILATDRNIDFTIQYPDEPIQLLTDPKKVQTILQNYLSNAIKFTEQGGVTLSVIDYPNEVDIVVSDTGIGISEEDIESIFQEFRQVDPSPNRKFEGTGLGLAICKTYSKQLHGRINVESTLHKGSSFHLILPKNAFSEYDASIDQSIATPVKQRPVDNTSIISDDRHRITNKDKTILVIDDDEKTLLSIRDYFNAKGIKVIVAATGENGLFLADYFMPTSILLDYKLPKIDGIEVIHKLRANPRTKHIPISLISGVKHPNEIDVPFFSKPLSKKAMNKILMGIPDQIKRSWRILLVEDDELHLRTMVEYIQSHNENNEIEVDMATTKKETLLQLEQHRYSLLIVDLTLPDAKEFELIEAIRADKQYQNIPIIVLTGRQFTNAEEATLRSMVDDIIIKAGRSPERLLQDINLFLVGYNNDSNTTDKSIFEHKNILIVDDDIRNIFALTGLLETYNINVVFNTSGKDTLNRLKDQPELDLILMDIMMPEMDGYETMGHIRKMNRYKDTPIIALTAKTMRGDRDKCIEAGATEYLSKPLNKDKLFSVLRVWLQ